MSDQYQQGTFDGMVEDQQGKPVEATETEERASQLSLANFSDQLDMDSDDVVIPRIRLAQGLTKEVQDGDAVPGDWLLTGYEPKKELTIVPLKFARQRTLREEDGGAILCKSADAKTGVPITEGEGYGGDCASCPMSQWGDKGPKGESNPPKCHFGYVYICFVEEHGCLALIEFRRTNIQSGKTLNTIAAQRGLGNFAVKLKSAKQSGKRGTFHQIVVQPIQASADLLANAKMFA